MMMTTRPETERTIAPDELLEALRRPGAYPWPVPSVEVLETHISWIVFAGEWVLKIKKPIRLEFLDYGTLERRRHYCDEEVRLNSRLAPDLYHGVVSLTRDDESLRVDGEGEVLEWAVKMSRLPEESMLYRLLESGTIGEGWVDPLTRLLVDFHRDKEPGNVVRERPTT